MGFAHLPFLLGLGESLRIDNHSARQELNSADNHVAAALQSLTRRKPNQSGACVN